MNNQTISTNALHSFAKSDSYDKYRPSYPSESLEALLSACHVAGVSGARLLDLGAGTGKFTSLIAARPEEYEILAVEPHDEMRSVLEGKKLLHVTAKKGMSTELPTETGSVDALICSQSFHWFANRESLQEFHRVIKDGGVLGIIWNIEDYNANRDHKAATEWEGKLQDLIWTFDDESPRFRHERWRAVFDDQLKSDPVSVTLQASPLFSLPLGEHVATWTTRLTKDELWNRFNTLSQIAVLEGKEREKARATFDEALKCGDAVFDDEGRISVHGSTFTFWTTKVPA